MVIITIKFTQSGKLLAAFLKAIDSINRGEMVSFAEKLGASKAYVIRCPFNLPVARINASRKIALVF